MDEKLPLRESLGEPPLQPRRMVGRSRPSWAFWVFGLVACVGFLQLRSRTAQTFHHCHHQGRISYAGERITWEICGDLKGRPLECSNITVPMDQFDPGKSNKTFEIPLIRLRGKNATQNLLLNPGGPGGSGSEFVYRRGEQLNAIVGEGFHLLSFDPRGINASRPLASCYPDLETRRQRGPVRDASFVEDSPEVYAWTQNFVKACADNMGEIGAYVNTPQTAADMNSILDAVGQEDMIYWGFSYGTILGQTYAGLFPERSKRVIIDGVANQFDWYEGLLDVESQVDTENVLDSFFDECVKAGKNCSLSSIAASKEELWEKLAELEQSLDPDPLSVYVNTTTYGTMTYQKILYDGIFPALYKPATWYDLADRLAKWFNGNATEAFLAYGGGDPWELLGDGNSFVIYNDGVTGPSHWPKGRQALLDMIVPYINGSMFRANENNMYYRKQAWEIPQTHNYVPKYGVKTAHPLLILSTTYDPVCPLVSAHSANAAFEGSQIVEVKGFGHCSVSVASQCTAKHIRAFLYNGTLPDAYTQCEVDGPYFVKPDEEGKAVALMHFEDDEQQKIHLAQVQLAREWTWPPRW